MARYCFYCGRELSPGEKCTCRSENSGTSSKDSKRQSKDTNSRTDGESGSAKGGRSRASSGPRIHKERKKKAARPAFRLRTFTDQLRTIFPTFSSGATSGAGYLLRPATKIRQESLRARRSFSIINIAAFVVTTGLLGVLLVYSGSHLFVGMMNSIFGKEALNFCLDKPVLACVSLMVLSLAFVFVLSLGFFIASRFGNRKPTFRKTLDLVAVSLVYVQIPELILLVSIILGGRSSIALLFVSLILMGMAQLLAFRSALGLSEDVIFLMIVFVYSSTYLVAKLMIFILVSVFFPV